jgi:WD40 repeat protein
MKNCIGLMFFCITSIVFAQPQSQTQSQPAAPPSSDIYLFQLRADKIIPKGMRNITSRKGYDNQPYFLPDSTSLFYTSTGGDEQTDIFLYNIETTKSTKITSTPESEYSPTLTPDGQFISTVRVEKDTTQRLWKFPRSGGNPILVLKEIKPVGYHAWIDSNTVALFILGEPPTLRIADVSSGTSSVVATDIGRSLQKIPEKSRISFVQNGPGQTRTIKEYDPKSKQISDIIRLPSQTEDYAWSHSEMLWTARNTKVLTFAAGRDKDWVEQIDLAQYGLKKISRIAISPDEKWIAFVAEE